MISLTFYDNTKLVVVPKFVSAFFLCDVADRHSKTGYTPMTRIRIDGNFFEVKETPDEIIKLLGCHQ